MKDRVTAEPAAAANARAWHAMTADEAVRAVTSSPDGLSAGEARQRLAQYGPNVLARGKKEGPLELIWRQINNPLIWVLLASALVAMAVDPVDGIKNGLVILAVVVLNTLIGFVQEHRAGQAIEALSRMVPENVIALRDGRKATLPAADLVPGDVVMLAGGDKVPADMRLIAMRSLQIEEAALTGESVPTQKQLEAVAPLAAVGDRLSMAFAGTLVTYGTGAAVVVETAEKTELGRISAMLKETTDLQTPLTRALATIAMYITIAIVIVATLMMVIGTWRAMAEAGAGFLPALGESVIFAIALAVGAIPEGLPAIVTIALAIGVQRMAARRAIVRRLPAVETLGSTTVICSDKTGTLTRNEMTVQALWTPRGVYAVSGVGYEPKGAFSASGTAVSPLPADARELLLAGALCNDAALAHAEGQWKITGDPTEGALVVAAEKAGIAVEHARASHARLDVIPFESENQFMVTLNGGASAGSGGAATITMKGAPEVVLKRCATLAGGAAIDAQTVLHEVETLAAQGMRVLAIAAKPAAAGMKEVQMEDTAGGFMLLGIQGMIDPPRPEAIEAIRLCHQAGITVKMITGDHQATAQAIAGQLNILTEAKAVTSAQLAGMSDEQMLDTAGRVNVFARVAPEHKLRLVRALQARNEVVAMTGDGVNDAPALKQANIGVAMGITGTAVTKEVAAIVLADDNFASIAAAVEEGRRVYDNLIKSLAFVLPTNLGLALILMAGVAFFPFTEVTQVIDGVSTTVKELLLPMLPTQLLWINLVAAVALALPLAFEAKEPNVMRRPPRRPDAPVLSPFVVFRTVLASVLMTAGCVGLFLWDYWRKMEQIGQVPGLTMEIVVAEAQTMAVTTVVMFQIFYLLNCRSLRDSVFKIGLFSNKTVFIGIATVVLLQLMFIYAPFMHAVFGSAALDGYGLGMSVLAGAIILPVISLEKWIRNRMAAGRAEAVALRSGGS